MARHLSAVALPVQPDFEPFHVVAYRELAAHPLVLPGVCFNPQCSRRFAPTRDTQVFCSAGCREAGDREMRKFGHRAAPAILAWQMGRYAHPGALADLSRAGRRFYSSLAADWWRDRKARIGRAEGERGAG